MRAAAVAPMAVAVLVLAGCATGPTAPLSSPDAPASPAAPEAVGQTIAVPVVEQAIRPLTTSGRPRAARLSIRALHLRDVRAAPYAGSLTTAPAPRSRTPATWPPRTVEVAGRPRRPRQLPGHRPPDVLDPAVRRDCPTLRPGARVVLETATHRLVYEVTRTRSTSFRSGASLRAQSAAVPGPHRARRQRAQ